MQYGKEESTKNGQAAPGLAVRSKEWEYMNSEQTLESSVVKEKDETLRDKMELVYAALVEKGYNPINQIVGYILSEDPTYITTYNNARNKIRHVDRDELLQELVRYYLGVKGSGK